MDSKNLLKNIEELIQNNKNESSDVVLDKIRKIVNTGGHPEVTDWLKNKYGDNSLHGDLPNTDGLKNIIDSLKSSGVILPWENVVLKNNDKNYAKVYSMFPLTNKIAWDFYCMQEAQMWSAKELDFRKDRDEYPKLPKRYQQLYGDILAFFSPGDGLIVKQAVRYLKECETFSEAAFLIAQIFIELVHAESYGMSIESVINDQKTKEEIFEMVDKLDCVKAKAKFIEKYEDSNCSKGLRYIAGAASEGIFFVSLFVVIFYMKSKGIMKTFMFLNEQVSKDETLHRDYNSIQAKINGGFTSEEAVNVLKEAIEIEMEHIKYILREPIDTLESDTNAGLTLDNIRLFIQGLADQILILAGQPTYFNSDVTLPWMTGLALSRKANFYEIKVGNYKKVSLTDAIDWEERAGLKKNENKGNTITNPNDVDF